MKTKTGYYTRTKARTEALYDISPAHWGIIRHALTRSITYENYMAMDRIIAKVDAILDTK